MILLRGVRKGTGRNGAWSLLGDLNEIVWRLSLGRISAFQPIVTER